MLINLSNHPLEKWSEEQIKAAIKYGSIVDLSFPYVDPMWSSDKIFQKACLYEKKVIKLLASEYNGSHAVHLMGELTLCFAILKRLQSRGILCIASTSDRLVVENGNSKIVEFSFCQFREYNI
jgi:hypothetical protein